jgi:hypothetical protein
MRSVMVVVLALARLGASAQVVYKCVGVDGSIAYQSNRCDTGQQATGAWSAEPDTPAQVRRAQMARQRNAQQAQTMRNIRRTSSSSAAVVRSGGNGNGCANAKAARDRYYDKHRRISLATMEYWEDRVSRACGY